MRTATRIHRDTPRNTPRRSRFGAHRRLALAGALTLAAATATGSALAGGSAPADAAMITASVPLTNWDSPAWAAEWMTGNTTYTQATAVQAATRFDVIAAMPRTFTSHAPAMHAANPDLVLLVYTLGPFANRTRTDLPESLYAHNAAGGRVSSSTFNTQLVNMYMDAWKAEQLRVCNAEVARSRYDGCFIDSMGNGILQGDYLSSVPIDPRTNAPYTRAAWIRDARDVANYVRDRVSYPVVTNGLGSGGRYFSSEASQLALGSDLAMAEGWLRAPHASNSTWPSQTEWRQSIDMIADSEARGSGTLTVTKMWNDAGTPDAVAKQWYDYTLGTFMLGTQGRSAMYFLKDGCTPYVCGHGASDLSAQPAPALALGPATAPYAALGNGLFARPFSRGAVVVNPATATIEVTLPAGATYTDLDGRTLSGRVGVEAHDSLVLTHTGGTPTTHLPTADQSAPPPPVDPAVTCDGKPATLVGTRNAETLTGTAGDDVIVSRHGNDTINGLGGNDTICAGDGNDRVNGGPGADVILGGNGLDTLYGSDGDDTLQGTAGDDLLYGEAGDDLLMGGDGIDAAWGGAGTNTFRTVETIL